MISIISYTRGGGAYVYFGSNLSMGQNLYLTIINPFNESNFMVQHKKFPLDVYTCVSPV